MSTVTITRVLAVKAADALDAAGDQDAARALRASATPIYVLRGTGTDGCAEFLDADGLFGSPAAARLFTADDRDAFDLATVTEDTDDARFEETPSEADIADMHENSDPDRVDEYIALMGRANRHRARLTAAAS